MGGKETTRGIVYQAFAAILENVTQTDWEQICVEDEKISDKADITLKKITLNKDGKNVKIIKCIQVKSSINNFSETSIKTWLNGLLKDAKSDKYELLLIGQCTKPAVTFMNCIKKCQDNETDCECRKALKNFDTSLLEGKKVSFVALPFDERILESLLRDALHHYISITKLSNKFLSYDNIDFLTNSKFAETLINSISGKTIGRKEFNDGLKSQISQLTSNYEQKKITLWIKSLDRGTRVSIKIPAKHTLSFLDKFNGRSLKDKYSWNENIYKPLKKFLQDNTYNKNKYQLLLDVHSSIVFAAGRVLNSKSGIEAFPIQKNEAGGETLWDVKQDEKFQGFDIKVEKPTNNGYDSALIINITRNIYYDVLKYLKDNNLPVGKIINCMTEFGTNAVKNGTHADALAKSACTAITEQHVRESNSTLHIFFDGPSSFMFFLGHYSRTFGNCQLYEYHITNAYTYSPSIYFHDGC